MLWLKALHIVAVVCWFAGLFYLPRLFVYHTQADDTLSRERFKLMERRLYFGIMTPCAIATVIFGLWLLLPAWSTYTHNGHWMFAKLALVLILVGYHIACGWFLIQLKENRATPGHVFFRWFNEFPVLILLAVVILVVVRPF